MRNCAHRLTSLVKVSVGGPGVWVHAVSLAVSISDAMTAQMAAPRRSCKEPILPGEGLTASTGFHLRSVASAFEGLESLDVRHRFPPVLTTPSARFE